MSKMMVKRDGSWTPMEGLKGDTGPLPADNSVTNDALVTDGAKTNTAYLMGNRLTKDAEGELISVDDSYPSAALSLTVDGKSTQVQTTGKNLMPNDRSKWPMFRLSSVGSGTVVESDGQSHYYIAVPLEEGQSAHFHRNTQKYGGYAKYCSTYPPEVGASVFGGLTITNYADYTLTNDDGTKPCGLILATPNGVTEAELARMDPQLEYGTSFTGYEPYSGGFASPRPDWPQEIVSADTPSMHSTGTNLLGGDALRASLEKDDRLGFGENEYGRYAGYGASSGSVNLLNTIQYKPNTAYTIVLTLYVSRQGTSCNLIMRYTNGSTQSISAPQAFDGETTQTFAIVTSASKTFLGLYRQNNGGTTRIYYDQCGVFEGAITIDDYVAYLGRTAQLLPEGTSLRSLPDGTKDELYLTYLRPSSREGWAWYSRELVQRCEESVFQDGGFTNVSSVGGAMGFSRRLPNSFYTGSRSTNIYCSALVPKNEIGLYGSYIRHSYFGFNPQDLSEIAPSGLTTEGLAEFNEWNLTNPITVVYPLATPITTQLDPIELPIMQAGTTNIWSDPSTNLSVTYERDRNIVISKLEAAAADLATS